MEPKSPKPPSAADIAALRAAVVGVAAEPAIKLSKPVADVAGFRSTTWTAAPSAIQTASPPVASLRGSASPSPSSAAPAVAPRPAPVPAAKPPEVTVGGLLQEVGDLRRMVAAMSESLRSLEARLATVQAAPPRG
ncbi:MAG: hypothetical protein HEQ23_05185 [Tepidisphaera sp.]